MHILYTSATQRPIPWKLMLGSKKPSRNFGARQTSGPFLLFTFEVWTTKTQRSTKNLMKLSALGVLVVPSSSFLLFTFDFLI